MTQRIIRVAPFSVSSLFVFCCCLLLSSCQRGNSLRSSRNDNTPKLTEAASWADKRRQGIDFIAIGNSLTSVTAQSSSRSATAHTWQLDIDFSKQMLFQSLDGPELLMPMPKPQPTGKGLGVLLDSRASALYASTSRKGTSVRSRTSKTNRLKVNIEPVTCRDPLTQRDYAYTVMIEANGKRYVGCGAFIKGSDRLNGDWTLETFRGQRLRPDQFGDKKLPSLSIDLANHNLTGSTGWSRIKGNIHADGDHLTIDPRANVRKNNANPFEAQFLEALQQSSLFRIGKDRLTLLVNGQYAMTLRKG